MFYAKRIVKQENPKIADEQRTPPPIFDKLNNRSWVFPPDSRRSGFVNSHVIDNDASLIELRVGFRGSRAKISLGLWSDSP